MSAIRPMVRADVEAVLELWSLLMANGQAADPRFSPLDGARVTMRPILRDLWCATQPFPGALLATEGERIVGVISGTVVERIPVLDLPPTARIRDLFVLPEARRQGLGRALVEDFIERAHAAGYPAIEVGTLSADERAVAFWHEMGFGDWLVTLVQGASVSPSSVSPSSTREPKEPGA